MYATDHDVITDHDITTGHDIITDHGSITDHDIITAYDIITVHDIITDQDITSDYDIIPPLFHFVFCYKYYLLLKELILLYIKYSLKCPYTQGVGENVPRYLKFEGDIKNRHITRSETNELINGFWHHRLTTQEDQPVRYISVVFIVHCAYRSPMFILL